MDILLWGGTSSTGRVIAGYLLNKYGLGKNFSWALGGRNIKKLEELRTELALTYPVATKLQIFTADSMNVKSLNDLVPKFKVIATTVGPYAAYGESLVAACAKAGVDYCDLTGEVTFVKNMIEKYHQKAIDSGARIVPSCGFDSIPSDLGTLMLQVEAIKKFGRPCDEVKFFVTGMKGGIGGGTSATIIYLFDLMARDKSITKVLADPNALIPAGENLKKPVNDELNIKWSKDLNKWVGPFIMAPFNTRVVRRSNYLLKYKYGKNFQYSEKQAFGKGSSGFAKAALATTGLIAAFGLLAFTQSRKVISRYIMPKPGVGPSYKTMASGFFKIKIIGFQIDTGGSLVQKITAQVGDDGDPGHKSTSKMLAESAIYLAQNPRAANDKGGILTPASALGLPFIKRLQDAGMTFLLE
jgi:short subunit dehydrogenase-like uncharacterized protein